MTITETLKSATGNYRLDPAHSRIGFVARHAMVAKVRGSFNGFAGTGYFDAENPSRSSLELVIDATSIDTRNADRDAHLRSSDFFDMEQFPTISFVSTAVEPAGDALRVIGDLTIKGVTNSVTLEFSFEGMAVDADGETRVGFEGRGEVNRKDWGVSWNAALDAGGVLVGDKVGLEFEVSALRIDAPEHDR